MFFNNKLKDKTFLCRMIFYKKIKKIYLKKTNNKFKIVFHKVIYTLNQIIFLNLQMNFNKILI